MIKEDKAEERQQWSAPMLLHLDMANATAGTMGCPVDEETGTILFS